ncbi:monovalent cation/H+ antiporter subunit A [Alkalilimnicola sp. S0819]|uniref:monovalent cation/H+ antiporter subunit A n=1 Tax=Alkalilimnicola sp. S0819 TaxID=2613922 RepID=UPI001261FA1D|nr:monovalent cation/H+ antiporter subunit A [Alkalilimnicola sp. S0819]KAB7623166.1 monovalent cation/H+ antiporter subunit A [Alkalilimnicola sp. S0819]MPQ17010.1 monovalent cation/H+ antiporter subunit A [Alkalilimnicola sp. S0819]
MNILLIVLLPFLFAWLPVLTVRSGRSHCAWMTAAPVLTALALLLSQAPAVFRGETLQTSWAWLPQVGLNFSLMIDGLGFMFALLILGIGLLVILYARYYLSDQDPMGRFYGFLLLFMGAMLGVVLSDNLILLTIFWELTSLSSFLLIGYWKHRADARQGARMALTITGAGGLAMLAGVILLGTIAGSFQISEVMQRADIIQASPWYLPMLVLILLGAFTKSAQFPFHFWLPHAMAAPTPVSAYLHSATMVKAGVFLLARLFPALAGTEEWFYLVSSAGTLTLLFGAYVALFQHDLKGLLAYSTISHLGLITLLFGLGTPLAAVAGVFHILNHATFKASLFMAAGIVDHETGTRDIRVLGGLFKYMPHTATLALVAAAAMAGVPLLNGFLSKEMFFAEVLHADQYGASGIILPILATLGGVFSVAYSLRFIHDVFFGKPGGELPNMPHEPPRYMKVPVEILVGLSLAVGIVPTIIIGGLLATAAGSVLLGELPHYSLAIWHGLNLPLLMSAIALAGGTLIYWQRAAVIRLHDTVWPRIEAKPLFDQAIAALRGLARWLERLLDNRSLQRYATYTLLSALALGALAMSGPLGPSFGELPRTPAAPIAWAVWALLIAGCLATVLLHRRRLVSIVVVGVVGLILSIGFAYLSAPDLALTQLSVELVTTILLLLALNLLPKESPRESGIGRRTRDGLIAAASGLGLGALVYAAMTRPLESISLFHLLQSKPGGGGTNVVNVILVDFRGFDTLGEITVLGIAALGVYAMLDKLREDVVAVDGSEARWPMMLQVGTRLLLPFALLVAAYIFLRGHNLPGGGFIAGLIASVALIMQYMASGTLWAAGRLWNDYRGMIAMGLLVATLTGIGSWFVGHPFLTSAFTYLKWPLVGKFEVASAIAFDLGVFLAVVGSVVLMLTRLGALREEPARRAGKEEN